MDNRITKRRLSDFLSYEWILMIVAIVAAIVVWELAYTIGSVRLSVGQQFKFYYDESIDGYTEDDFYSVLVGKNTFSYDVLELNSESLTSDYNVLSVRLSIQEGDILITDKVAPKDDAEGDELYIRAKSMVDSYSIYTLEGMLSDARTYLRDNFFTDAAKGKELSAINFSDLSQLDDAKIRAVFLDRMSKDNRFRSAEQKEEGFLLEKGRIQKLMQEVHAFGYFMDNAPEECFFNYTKYEQSHELEDAESDNKEVYYNLKQREIDAGRENAKYGINVEFLKDSDTSSGEQKKDPSAYFKVKGNSDAKDVVMMAFNFREYQPHLQFETISFMNTVIRQCSDIIDNV